MNQLVLGSLGLVGSALCRALERPGTILGWDLRQRGGWERYFDNVDIVYLAAARVGGIGANILRPGEFIYDNLLIQANVIHAAVEHNVKLVVFFGSSCIYPANAKQPITEDALLTGPLEPTNESYAVAKITGIKMLEAYNTQYGLESLIVMPCNLYGPNDNFDLGSSHLVPTLIRRFYEAKLQGLKEVRLWGTGTPRRELLHVDDLARAVVALVDKAARGIVNVGTGYDGSIRDIADHIAICIDYKGSIIFDGDRSRNGVHSKVLSISKFKSICPDWIASGTLESICRWYENVALLKNDRADWADWGN